MYEGSPTYVSLKTVLHNDLPPDRAAVLHGLGRVLDLEDPAVGAEGRRGEVVAGTGGGHGWVNERVCCGRAEGLLLC